MPSSRQFLILDAHPKESLLREVLESTGSLRIVHRAEDAASLAEETWLGALIDLSAPADDAIAVARQLFTEQKTKCMVFLTEGEDRPEGLEELLASPAVALLPRPLSAADLNTFAINAVARHWTKEERLANLVSRYAAQKALTPREAEIIASAMSGVGRAELAGVLGISENTLKGPIRVLLAKCGAPSVDVLVNDVLRGAIE